VEFIFIMAINEYRIWLLSYNVELLKEFGTMNESNKASYITILGNTFLTILNIVFGVMSGSSSLTSEGINNASDVVNSLVGAFAVKISSQPATKEYPYKRERIEPLIGLGFSLLLFYLAYTIFMDGYFKLITGHISTVGVLAGVMAFLGIFINFYIMKLLMKTGKKNNSQIFASMGKEKFLDVLASIGVVITVIASQLGFSILDPILSFIIAILVLKTAWDMLRDNYDSIMGKIPKNLESRIKKVVLYIHEVQDVSLIKINNKGQHYGVALDIQLDDSLRVDQLPDITKEVKEIIIKSIQFVDEVDVEVD
jgi:cation diffusion facilitator family transporter